MDWLSDCAASFECAKIDANLTLDLPLATTYTRSNVCIALNKLSSIRLETHNETLKLKFRHLHKLLFFEDVKTLYNKQQGKSSLNCFAALKLLYKLTIYLEL